MIIEIKDGKQARAEREAARGAARAQEAAHEAARAGKRPQDAPLRSGGLAPDPFGKENYRRMKALLKERVSERRFQHSKGVAKTARKLARVYGYPNPEQARMAGLVHDWDKRYVGQAARDRVAELGVDLDPTIVESMPWLLHGPTGAEALRRSFPELGEAVFQAVARHTSGAVGMTDLDMIVFTADLIEPSRTFKDVEPVRAAVGKGSLEDLFFTAFKAIFVNLVQNNRMLHPDMVEIWNHYSVRQPGAQKGRLSSSPDPRLNN